MGEKMRNVVDTYRGTIFIGVLWLLSVSSVWFTFEHYVMLSGFAAALLKATFGLTIYYVFDYYVLARMNTFAELKNGNIAYALYHLGIFLLIAATISYA